MRDFLWQGFNTDKQLRTVFDGLLPLVGGSRKTYTNYRWSKPGDYSRQHETHYTSGDQFPFAYSTITDPLTGKTDGLMKKCAETNNCPKVFQYDSPIEFGGARASLVSTDGAGKDIEIPSNVRLFYAAGGIKQTDIAWNLNVFACTIGGHQRGSSATKLNGTVVLEDFRTVVGLSAFFHQTIGLASQRIRDG